MNLNLSINSQGTAPSLVLTCREFRSGKPYVNLLKTKGKNTRRGMHLRGGESVTGILAGWKGRAGQPKQNT